MMNSHKPNRIGDILIERGIISRAQLLHALDFQQARQLMSSNTREQRGSRDHSNSEVHSNELGEILVELGFITRDQLKKNLARQSRLRKTTLVVSFVAPLFTMACGGGGGGSAAPANKPAPQATTSVVAANATSNAVSSTPPQSPQSNNPTGKAQSSVAHLAGNASQAGQSKGTASQPSIAQSSPSALAPSSSTTLSQANSSQASSPAAVNGPVALYWAAPTRRLNGEHLDITEIGGYEVRYKRNTDANFQSIKITDAFTDTYYFDYLDGDYEFEIAAYDVDGLYSNFVAIQPTQ